MPPRLSPSALLLTGVVLLVGGLALGLLAVEVVTTPPAPMAAPAGEVLRWTASAVLVWVPETLQLVGAALVAGAFVVRALRPATPGGTQDRDLP